MNVVPSQADTFNRFLGEASEEDIREEELINDIELVEEFEIALDTENNNEGKGSGAINEIEEDNRSSNNKESSGGWFWPFIIGGGSGYYISQKVKRRK